MKIFQPTFYSALTLFFFLSHCRSIDPQVYEPIQKPKLEGVLAPNDKLRTSTLLAKGKVNGLESLDVDKYGNVFGGDKEGQILKVTPLGEITVLTNTGGRPLGVQFDSEGNLIIADAYKGLLRLTPKNELQTLVSEFEGKPFRFTDDLDIGRDGKIYFSDASIYIQSEYLFDLLEAKPHGRVFVYDPKTKSTNLLLDGLYFANGIALSKNEDFLLINETYRYRITKLWLKGPKKGSREDFISNLPGFPDNITRSPSGDFWLALFTVRNDRMDSLHPSPFLKKLIANLPKMFWPKPEPYGFAILLNEQGEILQTLQDPGGLELKEVTSAIQKGDNLYIGSLYHDRIGIYDLKGK